MIKRILVGLGGTPFTPGAIRHAVELAVRHEAEITGVTLTHAAEKLNGADHLPESGVLFHSQLTELSDMQRRIEQSIADFHAACDGAGLRERKVVRETGKAFSKLIAESRYHDLIVFGLKKVLKYDFHSGNPHDLLVDFMTSGVRPLLAVAEGHRSVARVLIAYSGSMESAKAMKRFVEMRLFPQAALKIVTFGGSEENGQALLNDASAYCRAHGYQVESQALPGSAEGGLLAEAAEWKADLAVVGISTRRVFLRRVLGDTALEIVENAGVPLFVCQ